MFEEVKAHKRDLLVWPFDLVNGCKANLIYYKLHQLGPVCTDTSRPSTDHLQLQQVMRSLQERETADLPDQVILPTAQRL